MLKVLRRFGFEEPIIRLIGSIYESTQAKVKKGSVTTSTLSTNQGVIQGCPLSPHLFNLFLEMVMNEAIKDYEGGIDVGGELISNLRYADDVVLLAETVEEVQLLTSFVEAQCQKYHLNINNTNTKVMKFGREMENVEVYLSTGRIEQVGEYKYLGVWFTQDRDTYRTIHERIKLGHVAMNKLSTIC